MKDSDVKEWAQQMQQFGTRALIVNSKLNDADWHENLVNQIVAEREKAFVSVLNDITEVLVKEKDPHTQEVLSKICIDVSKKEGNLDFADVNPETCTPQEYYQAAMKYENSRASRADNFDDALADLVKQIQAKYPQTQAD